MTKKFNLSSKSDMRKFEKHLQNEMYKLAEKSLHNSNFDINCPHCNNEIKVHEGSNTCPHCSNQVDVDLKLNI